VLKDKEAECARKREYYYRVTQRRKGHIPGNQGGRRGKSGPGRTKPGVREVANARPIGLSSADERQDKKNIREFICRYCGNNRLFVPDVGRKCRSCYQRKHLARKQRLQAQGLWGVQTRIAKQRRRARMRANGGVGVTVADWQWVLAKYGNACLCCGSDAPPTIDHVVPLSLGGPHDRTNIQPLCAMCNSIKRDTIADYRFDRPLAPMARDPRVVRYVE
jgi:5-methylcytosine-specific restriction endonuclease McrA